MDIYPDYQKNIINVSATLDEYLGNVNNYAKLSILKEELKKDYKNVIFIILDGLGYYVLKNHLPSNNILIKNIKEKLTSVFPSTTTNATITLMSMTYPGVHNWLGWSLYYKEIDDCVDIFLNKVSYKNQFLYKSFAYNKNPYTAYYNKKSNDLNVYTVFPPYVVKDISEKNYYYQDLDHMFSNLNFISKLEDKKLIYSYCGEPDKTMHEFGMSSGEAKAKIEELSHHIEKLAQENLDSLIIITADHGQIDVDEYIELYKDQDLMACLSRPLSVEVRAASAVVKLNKKQDFIDIINQKYHQDLKLLDVDELIKKGVFGNDVKPQTKEFLGDYLIVSKNKKAIAFDEQMPRFKGHHTGLDKYEMYVPLIIIGDK